MALGDDKLLGVGEDIVYQTGDVNEAAVKKGKLDGGRWRYLLNRRGW